MFEQKRKEEERKKDKRLQERISEALKELR